MFILTDVLKLIFPKDVKIFDGYIQNKIEDFYCRRPTFREARILHI